MRQHLEQEEEDKDRTRDIASQATRNSVDRRNRPAILPRFCRLG
jgi:hypothetical protein